MIKICLMILCVKYNKMINIKVGDLTLLDSGCIITPQGASVHFFIKDLEYVFNFVDKGEEKAQMKFISNNGKKLEIEMLNFNDIIGVGNINPLPMGKIDNKEIFLMFRVSMLKEGGKTMQYSWYLKEQSESNTANNE